MVITARIADFMVERILVDQGSSANVLFKPCFDRLKLSAENLEPHDQNLTGFTGDQITPLRKVSLHMTLGEGTKTKSLTEFSCGRRPLSI